MAITLDQLKAKCENVNNALAFRGRTTIKLEVMRSPIKGYNVILIKPEDDKNYASQLAIGLTGKEASIWFDGYFSCFYN